MIRFTALVMPKAKSRTGSCGKPAYAVCRMQCKCGRTNLARTRDGDVYCKSCGTIVTADLETGVYCSVDELLEDLAPNPTPDYGDDLRDRISQLEKDLADREQELSEACDLVDGYREKIGRLESELSEHARTRTDWEDLRKENAKLRESMDSAVESLRSEANMFRKESARLTEDNRALEATNRHLSAEMSKLKGFDLRDITAVFMEYAAAVNAIVAGDKDPEHMRIMVNARTVQMTMKLKGQGMSVGFHSPGEPLREGRVDVTESDTSEPEKDMTVLRSNRFGCRFRDDVFAPVVENVTVNRFRGKKEEEDDRQHTE